jgi:hypothetical protein
VLAVAAVLSPVAASAGESTVGAARTVEGRTAPCEPLTVDGLELEGGCRIIVAPARVTFTAVGIFGDVPLATCAVGLTVAIGPAGTLAAAPVVNSLDGAASGPCGDVLACRRSADPERLGEQPPWRGRLSTRGRAIEADLDACLDTCLGRFEGRLRLDLERTPARQWRMRADRAAVGSSGLELAGAWMLRLPFGDELTLDAKDAER